VNIIVYLSSTINIIYLGSLDREDLVPLYLWIYKR